MTTATQSQTYWKRIKVPADLAAAGWRLVRNETSAPFRLQNENAGISTPGFPNPEEAIEEGRNMQIELEEQAAIVEEGNATTTSDQPAAEVLPLNLVDEGWRLNCDRASSPAAPYAVIFREHTDDFLQTATHATAAAAIAEALALEAARQRHLEERETAADNGALDQAAGRSWDQTINDMAGEDPETASEPPAEIMLELSRIRLDGGTQQRVKLEPETIARYREAMEGGAMFPPVDVFFDGSDYWLADGFYRYLARGETGTHIAANVRQGTQRDAILFSVGANETHGLPRTNEDKRRAVLTLLEDPEWRAWSDGYIAECARVSPPFVGKLRKTIRPAAEQTARRGRDQRVRDTAKIGAPAEELAADRQLPIPGTYTDPDGYAVGIVPPVEAGVITGDDPDPVVPSTDETPAETKPCHGCGKAIGPADYCNAAGLCFDCSGKGKKKAAERNEPGPAGGVYAKHIKTTPAKVDHEPPPVPTLEELRKNRDLEVRLSWSWSKPGVLLTIQLWGKKHGGGVFKHELATAEVPTLPDTILELIEADAKTLRTTKAIGSIAAPARKPAAKKKPAPPRKGARKLQRTTATKGTGKRRISPPKTSKPGAITNGRSKNNTTTTGRSGGKASKRSTGGKGRGGPKGKHNQRRRGDRRAT